MKPKTNQQTLLDFFHRKEGLTYSKNIETHIKFQFNKTVDSLKKEYPKLEKSYNLRNLQAVENFIGQINVEKPHIQKLVFSNSVL